MKLDKLWFLSDVSVASSASLVVNFHGQLIFSMDGFTWSWPILAIPFIYVYIYIYIEGRHQDIRHCIGGYMGCLFHPHHGFLTMNVNNNAIFAKRARPTPTSGHAHVESCIMMESWPFPPPLHKETSQTKNEGFTVYEPPACWEGTIHLNS